MDYFSFHEFPLCNSIDHTSYFKEQFVFLFFNLTRKTNPKLIEKLASVFKDVLQLLKSELTQNRKYGYPDTEFRYLENLNLSY